ncbi:recombinase family protein [Actinoplanes sp. HUAS TT8]|uniref:recombinase family protein n=1 Tax=Actinoplanes sp. HUAS TT8 TaxID=3447453 RepID=UPI003F5202CD
METVIYLRVSQDRTGEELSVTRQREDARKLAKLRGWRVVGEFVDNDISAAGKRKRPGFESMLEALAGGEAQGLIAWDLTRLTRNSRDRLRLLEIGKARGISITLVRGSEMDLSTPAGRLTADILGSVAQHEIEQKSDRQKRSAEQAAEQGRRIGGRRPFGYDSTGMVLDRKEAAAVRWGYMAVLAGVPLGSIARRWNERGHITPQAAFGHGCEGKCAKKVRPRDCPQRTADTPSPWTAQGVRPVLLNPRYAGFRSHVTEAVRDREPDPRKARIAGIVGPARWPAIVGEQTWRAVVAVLLDPERTNVPRSGQALLTGLATCGVCGSLVHGGRAPKSIGLYRTYRCRAALGHIGRMAEPVEWWITEVVVERMSRPDASTLLKADDRPDAEEVRAALLALRARRRNVLDLVEDGTYSAAEARQRVARLDAQIREAEAGLTDAGRVDVLGPLVDAVDVRAAWALLGVDRQRAVVDALMAVRLLPPGRGRGLGKTRAQWEANAARISATVEITWHGEPEPAGGL